MILRLLRWWLLCVVIAKVVLKIQYVGKIIIKAIQRYANSLSKEKILYT